MPSRGMRGIEKSFVMPRGTWALSLPFPVSEDVFVVKSLWVHFESYAMPVVLDDIAIASFRIPRTHLHVEVAGLMTISRTWLVSKYE